MNIRIVTIESLLNGLRKLLDPTHMTLMSHPIPVQVFGETRKI